MNQTAILSQLQSCGWTVAVEPCHVFQLPDSIAVRYPRLPPSLVEFLSGLRQCVDPSETRWFLCQSDYDGTGDSAFRWDEWEQLSLEAAGDDAEAIAAVQSFWDEHFPIVLSIGSGYAFYAVSMAAETFGQIVEGYEPEFEEVSVVAGSFESFITALLA